MRLSVEILPLARSDLREIGLYFRDKSVSVSIRFNQAVDRTVRFLLDAPESGERRSYANPDYADLRVWRINGFSNYLIFYRVVDETLQIVRVLHGARNYAEEFDAK